MRRKILAVVVSLIAAVAVIMITQMMNYFLVMPPSAEIINDPAKMRAYLYELPTTAYVVILIGYFLGALVAGFLIRNMSRREQPGVAMAILIGTLLTAGGLVNFFIYFPGQPAWVIAMSLLMFIPVSVAGHRLAGG